MKGYKYWFAVVAAVFTVCLLAAMEGYHWTFLAAHWKGTAWLILGQIGVLVAMIRLAGGNSETKVLAEQAVVDLFLTCGFFALALAWFIRG